MVLGACQLTACNEEDEPVATVMFCHALGLEGESVEMVVQVSQGDTKRVFKAGSRCCTPCTDLEPGVPTNLVLSDFTGELYRTETQFEANIHYILIADLLDGSGTPSLGLSNMTEKDRKCETGVPAGWSRCGQLE